MARRRTLSKKRTTYRKSINKKRRRTYRKTRRMRGGGSYISLMETFMLNLDYIQMRLNAEFTKLPNNECNIDEIKQLITQLANHANELQKRITVEVKKDDEKKSSLSKVYAKVSSIMPSIPSMPRLFSTDTDLGKSIDGPDFSSSD